MKFITMLFKWLIILILILFSIALYVGNSLPQAILLTVIILVLIYWPKKYLYRMFGKGPSRITRALVIIMMLIPIIIINSNNVKKSIYTSEYGEKEIVSIYNNKMQFWPENYLDIYLETTWGTVHVLAAGDPDNPPILLLHAASMGAHSWAENLPALLENFRIYAVDNPGEGNKSVLSDPTKFPADGKELSDLYASICDSLEIENSPVVAASNGGFIGMNYAYYYPERVGSLVLLGPMGLTQISGATITMMTLPTMYPFQFVYDRTLTWALGSDKYVMSKYRDWFQAIIKHTIPSLAAPVPMTTEQKNQMDLPILLFLGTDDGLVGDAEKAAETASEFPNITIEVLNSGHIIGVEKAEYVNGKIGDFLN